MKLSTNSTLPIMAAITIKLREFEFSLQPGDDEAIGALNRKDRSINLSHEDRHEVK